MIGLLLGFSGWAFGAARNAWPFEVTDLRNREKLVILVLGDGGTGDAGQYRVGQAMYEVCRQRNCDLALMLGDNIYENGIEVKARDSVDASYREIIDQFDEKFEKPYKSFVDIPGFHFWVTLGNQRLSQERLRCHAHLLRVQLTLAVPYLPLRDSTAAGVDPNLCPSHRHRRET